MEIGVLNFTSVKNTKIPNFRRNRSDYQWIFFEGINSQITISSSDSRNTTVYFFL